MCMYVYVFVEMEERRDYNSWRIAEDGGKKKNLQELNKGVESQESIRPVIGMRLRSLSLGLRGPPHQDLLYTLVEEEDYWIRGNERQ